MTGKDGGIFGGQCGGGNAGNGGNGSYGGSYGTGMVAFNTYDINKIINLSGKNYDSMLNAWTPDGIGGAGGAGGKGGTGGLGGKNTWGKCAPSGANGIDRLDGGGQGGDPRPHVYSEAVKSMAIMEMDISTIRMRRLR